MVSMTHVRFNRITVNKNVSVFCFRNTRQALSNKFRIMSIVRKMAYFYGAHAVISSHTDLIYFIIELYILLNSNRLLDPISINNISINAANFQSLVHKCLIDPKVRENWNLFLKTTNIYIYINKITTMRFFLTKQVVNNNSIVVLK